LSLNLAQLETVQETLGLHIDEGDNGEYIESPEANSHLGRPSNSIKMDNQDNDQYDQYGGGYDYDWCSHSAMKEGIILLSLNLLRSNRLTLTMKELDVETAQQVSNVDMGKDSKAAIRVKLNHLTSKRTC
jgi:hypothetical protein